MFSAHPRGSETSTGHGLGLGPGPLERLPATLPPTECFIGTFMFGTHTRAVLKRRQAMDLGSGRDPVIGSPPPCPPPSVS